MSIENQIAEHADEPDVCCPKCGEDSLVENNNVYGTWLECLECDYETEQE